MKSTRPADERALEELAVRRLCRIFGAEQGRRVFEETLGELGLPALTSADDLYAFSQAVSARGGLAAAVGAMLGVDAVLRGAARGGASSSRPGAGNR